MRDLSEMNMTEAVQAVRELLVESGLSLGQRVGVLEALLSEEREELHHDENFQAHWELTSR